MRGQARWAEANGGRALTVLGLCGVVLLSAAAGHAAPIPLADMNSTVLIDPLSSAGMNDWNVDGVSQLYQQWFWYRVGSTDREYSVDTLSFVSATPHDLDGDPGDEHLIVRYSEPDGDFDLTLTYTLIGGTPGSGSHINEQIQVTNTSGAPLEFHLFQYSDFNLAGDAGDDTVTISNGNTANQVDINQPWHISESAGAFTPSHVEANYFDVTRAKLEDQVPTTLDGTTAAGPGDVTWAFQWDWQAIPAGQSEIVSKVKTVVPEPGTLALLSLGGAGLLLGRRRAA